MASVDLELNRIREVKQIDSDSGSSATNLQHRRHNYDSKEQEAANEQ
jgi:hypothetical protein